MSDGHCLSEKLGDTHLWGTDIVRLMPESLPSMLVANAAAAAGTYRLDRIAAAPRKVQDVRRPPALQWPFRSPTPGCLCCLLPHNSRRQGKLKHNQPSLFCHGVDLSSSVTDSSVDNSPLR